MKITGGCLCGAIRYEIDGTGSNRPGAKNIKVGSIDDASFVKPNVNLYTAHALNYSHIDDKIDNFQSMPPAT